ncbi:TPA: SH3 domain-containing protein [Streptococcus suis]
MTKTSLTANQPRFSIRTYSLGAASVLLAYACLAAGPVASANTITNPTGQQTTVQTIPSNSAQTELGEQSSQTEIKNSNLNRQTISSNTISSNSQTPIANSSSNQTTSTSSQQTTATTRDTQALTGQASSSQEQTGSKSISSSAISKTTTSQTITSTGQHRISNQASTTSVQTSSTRSSTTGSIALGDNYPYKVGWQVDPWGMYTRQCTSFVAYRLSTVNGFTLPRAYGNADVWGTRARSEGYRVDMTPALGAVAWWNTMHVAWVTAIDGDRVEIEEYNFNYTTNYNRRWIPKNSVSGYIHFKDLAGGTTTSPSNTVPTNQTANNSLPSSGTYTFTGQAAIKAEPKQASTTLAYYQAGNTVNYDSIVEADGYRWLSYLTFAGNRRYIPIAPVAKPTTPQTPNTPTTPITKPEATIHIRNINQSNGSFDVVLTGVASPKDIKTVQVPIWSDNNGQDDIIWYAAQRQSDGSYKVNVQASKHKNDRGLYHIHVYYTDSSGKLDFVTGTTTQLSVAPTPTTPTSNLPKSGTYTFKSRLAIRSNPSSSAPILAYYGVGQSVRYDSIVSAEGKQWLSYISYSGARRYIAIP